MNGDCGQRIPVYRNLREGHFSLIFQRMEDKRPLGLQTLQQLIGLAVRTHIIATKTGSVFIISIFAPQQDIKFLTEMNIYDQSGLLLSELWIKLRK